MQPRLTSLRLSALGIATSIALAAGPVLADGRVLDSGLRSQQPYDGFIVRYRDGSGERSSPRLLKNSLQAALARASGSMRAPSAPRLLATRRLAIGADLIRFDRKLQPQDARALMRAIASDPNVEYVEPNLLLQAWATPNDTRYGEQWHYFEATGGLNLPAAWDRATGSGTVVAASEMKS
jgi:serine protease